MITDRERRQLRGAADLYLSLASALIEAKSIDESMTIDQVRAEHSTGPLSDPEQVLAHLASAAVRIATLCELLKGETATYDHVGWSATHPDHHHVHWLLRDNIGHYESGGAHKAKADARREALKRLTIKEAMTALKERLEQC